MSTAPGLATGDIREQQRGTAMAAATEGQVGADAVDLARVFDFMLGGADNYDADRQLAARLTAPWPESRPCRPSGPADLLQRSRLFMERAVRTVRGEGVRQFIDVGLGLPVPYEAAAGVMLRPPHEAAPNCRVAYVIPDPLSAAAARQRLRTAGHVVVTAEDPAVPEDVLGSDELTAVVDLARPVGLLVGLRCSGWPPWYGRSILGAYMANLAPGSYLAVTVPVPGADLYKALEDEVPGRGAHLYGLEDVEALFGGCALLGRVEVARGLCPEVMEADGPAVLLAGLAWKVRQPGR